MFQIGEFSKMCKTTVKTLRYYDEIGLLKPEYIDKFTKYRFYTTDQLLKLHNIQSLRQMGLTIDEIQQVMSGNNLEWILGKRRTEILTEIECMQNQLSRIEFILSGREEIMLMDYQAIIKEVPECIVYSTKLKVPNYDAYFKLIPPIGEKVTTQYPELELTTPPYCICIYLDGEYKEKDFNIEFCEAVNEMRDDFEDIVFKKLESIRVVSVMHKGAYSSISKAYAYAFKWIQENGYRVDGDPRENVIDGIWNKEEEEGWLTELQIPIRK